MKDLPFALALLLVIPPKSSSLLGNSKTTCLWE